MLGEIVEFVEHILQEDRLIAPLDVVFRQIHQIGEFFKPGAIFHQIGQDDLELHHIITLDVFVYTLLEFRGLVGKSHQLVEIYCDIPFG